MKPGIYYDIPSHEYHTGPGISKTGLDLIRQSPRHYFERYIEPLQDLDSDEDERPPVDDDTEAKLYGRALHALLLEPHVFEREFVVKPKFGTSKVEKEAKAEWEAAHAGCEIVNARQVADMIRMRDAVRSHPAARALLNRSGRGEVSAYAIDPVTGVLMRSRADWLTDDGIIVDLKSTGRHPASSDGFSRLADTRRYHVGSALYSDVFRANGLTKARMVYILVERSVRPKVACYMLDPEDVELGRVEYREDLATYRQCVESGTWPCYGDKVMIGRLPAWRRRQAGIE